MTVDLDSDLYAVVFSLAKAENCSISAAVDRLLRRSVLSGSESRQARRHRNGLAVSMGREPITADIVARVEAEADVL